MLNPFRKRVSARRRVSRPEFKPNLENLEERRAPAVLTVNTLLDNVNAGDTDLSLRLAVETVNAGSTAGLSGTQLAQISGPLGTNDTVQFSVTGTIFLNPNFTDIDITAPVLIDGPGSGQLAVDGGDFIRIFLIDDGDPANIQVTIQDVTLQSGSAADGGAVFNNETLTLRNSIVSGNSASFAGGGIYNDDDGILTLNNSIVRDNEASFMGGGVANKYGDLQVLNNSSVTGNTADAGGGVANKYGSVNVANSSISGNYARYEGAGLANYGGAVTISNSNINNNRTTGSFGGGGGVAIKYGTVSITATTISGNFANYGGGILNDGGRATITGSTISGNTADYGGGIYNDRGDGEYADALVIVNSTISGNSANGYGGGIANYTYATITNSTITANVANADDAGRGTDTGGGIYSYIESGATLLLRNTIVAGNFRGSAAPVRDDIDGDVDAASANNLIGAGTGLGGITNGTNGNQIGTAANPINPLLGPLQDNGGPTFTHAILEDSPARNTGNNSFVVNPPFSGPPFTDQRGAGFPRIQEDIVDIGAYEFSLPTDILTLVVGAGPTGGPHVKVFNADGSVRLSFFAYDPAFTGGVRVATGDFNNDGVDDIVTAPGFGGGPHIKVFDGLTGAVIHSFFAFSPNFTGGIFVATGDFNLDGVDDIVASIGYDIGPITAPGTAFDAGPHVRVFDGRDPSNTLMDFFAFDRAFEGGVRVAVGFIDGDDVPDIIAAAGPGGGPHVKVFSGADGSTIRSFFAYDPAFSGGVWVAAGDFNLDGVDDIVTGPGFGGGPHIKVFDGSNSSTIHSFFAYNPNFTGGVRVAVGDVNGDGRADIITGAGPNGGPHVQYFNGADASRIASFFAFDPSFLGGIYVAGNAPPPGAGLQLNTAALPSTGEVLDGAEVDAVYQQLLALFADLGVASSYINGLSRLEFQIADLPGATLGLSLGGTIVIDVDAAGHGWLLADDADGEGVDLFSVVLHELGHELGIDHGLAGFMADEIGLGERWVPTAEELDRLFGA